MTPFEPSSPVATNQLSVSKRENELAQEHLGAERATVDKLRAEMNVAHSRNADLSAKLDESQRRQDEMKTVFEDDAATTHALPTQWERQGAELAAERLMVATLRSQVAALREQLQSARAETTALSALFRSESHRSATAEARAA